MFNRIMRTVAPVLATILLFGCGKQHQAEGVVKEFIAQNIAVEDYSADFLKVDSTTHINDSMIERMRLAAGHNKLFKSGIKYGQDLRKGKYAFLPARIYVGKDTIRQTFYLDMDMSHVIAFK